MMLMELQVGDLLVGIGDVFLADSSPQEAMAQVASIVRVTLALKASHGCQHQMPAYKGARNSLTSHGPPKSSGEMNTCLCCITLHSSGDEHAAMG